MCKWGPTGTILLAFLSTEFSTRFRRWWLQVVLLFGITDGLFNSAASTPGLQSAVRGGRHAAVIEHIRAHGPGILAEIRETGALGLAATEELRALLKQCLAAYHTE